MSTEKGWLGSGVFGSRLAARLAQVSLRQLRYWVKQGLIRPSIYRAGRGGRDLFAYTDLVQARTIGRLRKQGASLARIRKSIDYLRAVLPEDEAWHTKTLVDDHGVLALMNAGEIVNTSHESPGQGVFVVSLADITRDLLRVGDDLSIGKRLEVNVRVQGGSPVVKGTRIPTRLIDELVSEGVEPDRIVSMYPGVTPAAIVAATEFERKLAAV